MPETAHPNERIARLCKGKVPLSTGDAARIACFLGPEPWTDEAVLETARAYVDELGPRSPRRRNRNKAGKLLAAAGRAGGRPGIAVMRVETPGFVRRALVEDFPVRVALPSAGHVARHDARASLPDAEDLIKRARDMLATGRRQARDALAGEMGAFGAGETLGWGEAVDGFSAGLDAFLAQQRPEWDAPGFARAFDASLADALAEPLPPGCGPSGLLARLEAARGSAMRGHSARRDASRARPGAALSRYAAQFPAARALGRRLVLIVGPTNSGKTHEALALAAAAGTSAVLSPLRLLAQEHRERLAAAGAVVRLVTGEETLGPEDAPHVACTVEAADLSRTVDVGVVDEVQMLASPHRGWAWTQALAGLPARTLVMTGSPDAVGMVESLARVTGEPLEVRLMQRKAPLLALPAPVSLDDVREGDAVVAFSRRAAMEVRDALQSRGREVAMVYGNLSPDVRRSEAARFRSRAAGVLVATDAVGMGLNLPIRRVLFAALEKFDGRTSRPLSEAEIRQVAGRAGRYGGAAEGEGACGVLAGLPVAPLLKAMSAVPAVPAPASLFVRPTARAVAEAAGAAGGSVASALRALLSGLAEGSPDLCAADMADETALAVLVDAVDLPARDRFAYACIPLSPRDPGTGDLVLGWAAAHAAGRPCRRPRGVPGTLYEAEILAQRLTAYLWMARRYPEVYRESPAAASDRRDTDALIESLLRANPFRRRPAAAPVPVEA